MYLIYVNNEPGSPVNVSIDPTKKFSFSDDVVISRNQVVRGKGEGEITAEDRAQLKKMRDYDLVISQDSSCDYLVMSSQYTLSEIIL